MSDPRAAALAALEHMHTTITEAVQNEKSTVGDLAYAFQNASITGGQAAMVHALLYAGDQLRLSNLLAAAPPPELEWQAGKDMAALVRHEIARLVDPLAAEARAVEEITQLRADLRHQTDVAEELRRQLATARRRLGDTA